MCIYVCIYYACELPINSEFPKNEIFRHSRDHFVDHKQLGKLLTYHSSLFKYTAHTHTTKHTAHTLARTFCDAILLSIRFLILFLSNDEICLIFVLRFVQKLKKEARTK